MSAEIRGGKDDMSSISDVTSSYNVDGDSGDGKNGHHDPLHEARTLWSHIFAGLEHEGFYLGLWSGRRPGPDEEGTNLKQPESYYKFYPEQVEEALDWCREQDAAGREVYFCAHLLTGEERTAENAAPTGAAWSETDAALIPEGVTPPPVRVESSPGRFHDYWPQTQPIPPEEGVEINRTLHHTIGGDSGWHLTKLLRVPGTHNYKYAERPMVRLWRAGDERYEPEELIRGLPGPPETGTDDTDLSLPEDEPPVQLTGRALQVWRGERPVLKDDGGTIDRSRTLYGMGCVLDDAGASKSAVAVAVAERDRTLGYGAYTDREIEYRRIAKNAAERDPEEKAGSAVERLLEEVEAADKAEANDFFWDRVKEHAALASLPAAKLGKYKAKLRAAGINHNDLETALKTARQELAAADRERASERRKAETGGLPQIETGGRQQREITDEAMDAFVQANDPPKTFVHGEALARIRTDAEGLSTIERLSKEALQDQIGRAADFVRTGKDGPVGVFPPREAVAAIHTAAGWPGVPPVKNLVTAPVLRPDGTVLNTPGYDPFTWLYYAPHPELVVPDIPESPTDEDIKVAWEILYFAFGGFPFSTAADKANAYGFAITPAVRQAITNNSQLLLVDGPDKGIGKDLLIETVANIHTGRDPSLMGAPSFEEEWRKQITSKLSGGAQIIQIGNVRGILSSTSLERAITAPTWVDRVLGETRDVSIPQGAVWAVSGNNLRIAEDLIRRCYKSRLDTGEPGQ